MAQQTCCDHKGKLKKGLWSPEEDEKLVRYVTQHGIGSWSDVPKHAGLRRCGKSCRLRWINYLRPDLKRGMFTVAEEDLIINLHRLLGNRWSQIASQLPGRTDNEIKNYWNSCIKKKLRKMGINPNAPNRPRMLGESSSREHLLARDVTPRLQPPAPLTLGQILPQNQPVVNPLREPDPIAVPPQYNNNGVFGHLGQTDAVVPQMAPQLVLPRLQVPIPEVQMHLLPVPNRPRLHGLDFHGYVYRRIVPADDVAMDIVGQNFPEQGEAGNEQDPSGELDYEDGESLDMSPRSEDDLDLDSMICQWCQGSLPQPPPEEYFQLYGDEPVRTAGPGPGQSSVSTQVDSWAHLMQRLGVDHQDDPMDEPMAPSVHNPRYQI